MEPGPDFPWQELRDASITILWAPGSQKLVWSRAAEANGMGGLLKTYTEKESALADLPDPKLPEVQLTEAEREARRGEFVGMLKTGARALGWGIGGLAAAGCCMGLAVGIARWRRSRRLAAGASRHQA
jgi:hypothetical protein